MIGEVEHDGSWEIPNEYKSHHTPEKFEVFVRLREIYQNLLYSVDQLSDLTSVGHEDLQAGVLKQVTPGEYGPDLTEHPLPV